MNDPTSTIRLRTSPEPTAARAALIAGLGYAALFALAIFANFFVRVRLVDPEDASATFANLVADETLLRLALVAFLAVFVIDVVVAWALQRLFRPVGAAAAQLAAWFRIVYTVFLGVACVFLFLVLQLLGGSSDLSALGQGQREAHTLLALEAFNATWLVGLICFGIHLLIVGATIVRSGIAARWMGAVLCIAGCAYVVDTTLYSLMSTYADHAATFTSIVAVPSVVAELSFTIWLLTFARRRDAGALEALEERRLVNA